MRLSDAANVMTPAYLTILSKGFSVRRSGDLLVAEKADDQFTAEGPVSLLGLIAIAEVRGEAWQATDDEVSAFVDRFGGSADDS